MNVVFEKDAPRLSKETGANSKEVIEVLKYFNDYNKAKNFLLRKNEIVTYDLGKSDSD